MANIVTVAVPTFIEESSEYDTQYKRTMKWNPEKGDFVRNAANQNVSFGRVYSELPTLNDVFLEITGKELRD